MLLPVLFVHSFHDLQDPGHNGFVVTILIELLEFAFGASGIEECRGAISEDMMEMCCIIWCDEV